jgi:hypothetical protein
VIKDRRAAAGNPRAETRHLLSYLLAGPEGERTVARIDAQVDRLPGLGGIKTRMRDGLIRLRDCLGVNH